MRVTIKVRVKYPRIVPGKRWWNFATSSDVERFYVKTFDTNPFGEGKPDIRDEQVINLTPQSDSEQLCRVSDVIHISTDEFRIHAFRGYTPERFWHDSYSWFVGGEDEALRFIAALEDAGYAAA